MEEADWLMGVSAIKLGFGSRQGQFYFLTLTACVLQLEVSIKNWSTVGRWAVWGLEESCRSFRQVSEGAVAQPGTFVHRQPCQV